MVRVDQLPGCIIQYSQIVDGDMKDAEMMQNVFAISNKTLIVPHLQHSSRIVQIPTTENLDCDAVFTLDACYALGIRVADCLPIVLSVPDRGIAIIHGGWRSLLDGIVEKTFEKFLQTTQANPHDVHVWIGPSIQACCNTMRDVPVQLGKPGWNECISQIDGEYSVGLQKYVKHVCQQFGFISQHNVNTNICTYHEQDQYFSYRRHTHENRRPGSVGHMGVVAWIER